MGKTWVLHTETKGTGANVVPLEPEQEQPDPPARRSRQAGARRTRPSGAGRPSPRQRAQTHGQPEHATDLPTGHVRKKATGEIGKVRSVDPKSGQAEVQWLKSGHVSAVPLSAISRR